MTRLLLPSRNSFASQEAGEDALSRKTMEDTNSRYQELILDAIDQLRHRKARPDADRIYHALFRRHSIGCAEAKVALELCVQSGAVLRVAYKGNISYRNAARKYSHLKRDEFGQIIRPPGKPRRKFTALLTQVFAELVLNEPDYLEMGVPPGELIRRILARDSVRYTKRYISILLEKEVEAGGLIRMSSGNFLVGPTKPDGRYLDQLASAVSSSASTPLAAAFSAVPRSPPGGAATVPLVHQLQPVGLPPPPPLPMPTTADRPLGSAHVNDRPTVLTAGHKYKKKNVIVDPPRPPSPGFDRVAFMESYGKEDRKHELSRVGSRKKRAKKVFDPSDTHVPRKRGRPLGSGKNSSVIVEKPKLVEPVMESRPDSRNSQNSNDLSGVCSVCHVQNKKGLNDKMVSCRECSNKAHASCLNGDDMMLKTYADNTWQCPHCKTCTICYETKDAGTMKVCAICADAYHMHCHQPKIPEKFEFGTKWLCVNCQRPEQLAVDHIQIGYNIETAKLTHAYSPLDDNSSPDASRNSSPTNYESLPPSPSPPTLSPQTVPQVEQRHSTSDKSDRSSSIKSEGHSFKEEDYEEAIDLSIPDATNWTPDEVYQYFMQYFPEEAFVFKEQEIDGHSLLLMKRMDVLKGLALKLGPALKIYRHVLKLQYRRDDPKLYWA